MAQMGFGDLMASQPPLRVVDDFGEVGKGASKAHYVRCENGSEYLIKGPAFTPDHPFVAANEFVAVRLARTLGLPVLGHEVAEMAGDLFFASQWMNGSTFWPGITPALFASCLNRDRAYGIVVLDAWILNGDRHHENLVVRQLPGKAAGDLLLLNDHSHCLVLPNQLAAGLIGQASSPISGSIKLPFLADAIVDQGALDAALTTAESVSDAAIEAIVASVPARLLSLADGAYYRDLLVNRRGQLRRLFNAERHIFPNLV